MKLRITVEGKTYDVGVEVLTDPETEASEEESAMAVPESVLRPPRLLDIRPQDKVCRSPIAGVVVSVAASLRQKIHQDDPVVIIEAMKMQTTVGAPADGVVEEVPVMPGDSVKSGQVLCKIS